MSEVGSDFDKQTRCPNPDCREEIWTIETINRGFCEHCRLDADALFDIAMGKPTPHTDTEDVGIQAVVEGGQTDV